MIQRSQNHCRCCEWPGDGLVNQESGQGAVPAWGKRRAARDAEPEWCRSLPDFANGRMICGLRRGSLMSESVVGNSADFITREGRVRRGPAAQLQVRRSGASEVEPERQRTSTRH